MPLRLTDYAQGVVLPEYTDEYLRTDAASDDPILRRRAELLLAVPAVQRQNIEAEVTRRASRSAIRWTSDGQAQSVRASTGNRDAAREAVVAAYLHSQKD